MNVILAKENADGSAVFTFDMTPEETRLMVILGLKTAILAGIEDAKGWDGGRDLEGLKDGIEDAHLGVPV
jgi:hypothetical protein